jgi:hypothetical protein
MPEKEDELTFGLSLSSNRPTRNMYELECENCGELIGRDEESFRVEADRFDGMGSSVEDTTVRLCSGCFPSDVLQ